MNLELRGKVQTGNVSVGTREMKMDFKVKSLDEVWVEKSKDPGLQAQEGEADSPRSTEPDEGLDPRTLRS